MDRNGAKAKYEIKNPEFSSAKEHWYCHLREQGMCIHALGKALVSAGKLRTCGRQDCCSPGGGRVGRKCFEPK